MKTLLRSALPLLLVVLPGCSDSAEPKPAVHLAWISKGRCNTFFDISRFGVHRASQDLLDAGESELTVDMIEPDDCPDSVAEPPPVAEECAAAALQMGAVQEAIDKGVQAIAISVSNPSCVGPLLDDAVERGIKVLTFDSDAPGSRRHVYYGMDNRAAGRLGAEMLAEFLGESGRVAIQTAMAKDANGVYQRSASTSYVERMAGIEEGLANYPDISLVATIPCVGNDVLDPACATELETMLDSEPDLAGLVLSRGKVLREVDLAEHAPELTSRIENGNLRAVGFDAPDDALDNIRAGYADFVVAQKQFGWGFDVMKLAHDMIVHGVEPPAFYDSGWYVVCPNNVDQYQRMWDEHDFRSELERCQWLE